VIADNCAGTMAAVNYLHGLGHRRIGFICGNDYLQSAADRRQGYEEALTELGVSIDPGLIAPGDFTRQGGQDAAAQLLRLVDRPTAIFAANDDSAFGVMEAARLAGLEVPQDLSVVGFDNVPEAASCQPALTTVDQEIGLIGQLAVRMVIDLIDGRSLAQSVALVPTRLIERSSCTVPRTGGVPEISRLPVPIGA
jgi:DNA-binding LacI/PurR family transcriptional regulator